jgi:hypothetical protein
MLYQLAGKTGAYHGRVVRDIVAAGCFHLYDYIRNPSNFIDRANNYRARHNEAGFPSNFPLYSTETGAWASGEFTTNDPSPDVKALLVKRWYIINATQVKGKYVYKHNRDNFMGAPGTRPEVRNAIVEAAVIAGKTIRQGAELFDNRIWYRFSDNTELTA